MRALSRQLASSLVCVAVGAVAEPMGRDINPGVLGPNALPTLAADSPWVDDELRVQLGWAGQVSTPEGGGRDGSMLVPFRVELGLYRRVAFWAEGSPFELFQYSPETSAAWQPRRSKGITRADVRLGTRVRLWNGGGLVPTSAVRVVLKTATGEDLYTRRFLDAPAYQLDLTNGWRWLLPGATRLEAWATVGFLAWQQGAAGQNDAFTWAATVVTRAEPVVISLEARGYVGWIRNDAPVTFAAATRLGLTAHLDLLVSLAHTVKDPPSLDAQVALRVRLPTTPPEAP